MPYVRDGHAEVRADGDHAEGAEANKITDVVPPDARVHERAVVVESVDALPVDGRSVVGNSAGQVLEFGDAGHMFGCFGDHLANARIWR